ncbi:MAG: hypothetical protein HYT87_19110, partial [Nitrospirae bacterium]|nr:hypothetical protein [Nitrospirota bacterium]
SGLTDGLHTVCVRSVDDAQNPDASPACYEWEIDTTPPAAPDAQMLTLTMNPPMTDDTLEGGPNAVEPNVSVEIYADALLTTQVGQELSLPDGSFPAAPVGDNASADLYVVAVDVAGNYSAPTAISNDIDGPDTQITVSPPDPDSNPSPTFQFSESGGPDPSTPLTFECSEDLAAWTTCTSPAVAGPFADGPHKFDVRAFDAAGNVTLAPATYSWTIDSGPPETTIDSTSPAADPTNVNSLLVYFSSNDPGATFDCDLDGGGYAPCTSPESETGLLDGNHTVYVRATDTALNTDPTPATYTWTVDTIAPPVPNAGNITVTMNAPGTNDEISGSAGAVEANAEVKVYADGLLTALITQDFALGDGSFGPKAIGDNMADGSDLVYVVAVDAAGNMSSATSTTNDITPPIAPTLSTPADGAYVNDTTPTLVWSSPGDANTREVQIASDGIFTSIEDSATGLGSDLFGTTTLAAGTHYWQVRVLDAAGNVGSYAGAFSFNVDATPPSAGTVAPSNTATATHVGGTFDISTTFSDSNGITGCEDCVSTDGTCDTEWTAATWTSGPDTCDSTGQTCSNGQSLTINMRATDSAGNVGTATPVSRTCDTAGPTTSDDAPVGWQGADVTVTLTPSDAGSGVASTVSCADGSDTCSPATSGTSVPMVCNPNSVCTQYVRYQSTDNLGNVQTVVSKTIQIDLEKPTTTDDAPAGWQTADTNVTLTPADGLGSGVASTNYCIADPAPPTISTFAGTGTGGFSGDTGAATSAQVSFVLGDEKADLAVDSAGNVYVADSSNYRVRKIAAGTGIITTVAGNGSSTHSGDGGAATSAGMGGYVEGVAVDSTGNIYLSNWGSHTVRKVDTGGTITTYAGTPNTSGNTGDGGPATSATLYYPKGLAVDTAGNLFISDYGNGAIRKVDTGGTITTVASGIGTYDVAVDSAGNLYIAGGAYVSKRDTGGTVTTFAGNGTNASTGDGGPATSAGLYYARAVTVDSSGNVYIAEWYGYKIRKVDTSGTITTYAGTGSQGFSGDGGSATSATFSYPNGLDMDSQGNIYVTDAGNSRVRMLNGSCAPSTSGTSVSVTCPASNVCKKAVCYQSTDAVSNAESTVCSGTIQIDKELPTSTISAPSNGANLAALITVSGTAADNYPTGSGVDSVVVALQRTSDSYYWDGAAWAVSQSWLATSGPPTGWSLDTSAITWSDGGHTIIARATDVATNAQSPDTSISFTFDAVAPSAPNAGNLIVTMSAPGAQDQISGTTGAVEANATVKVYSDGLLTALLGQTTAAGDGSFTAFNIGDNQGDGSDLIYVVAVDAATNVSSATSMPNDKTPPTASISGEPTGTNNTTVLAVTVSGADVTFYKSKVGAAGSTDCTSSSGYSAEVTVATNITDNISGVADGSVTLCVVGRDGAGNYQSYASATSAGWTKDATVPSVGTTNDGTGADVTWWTSTTNMDANWTAATDTGGSGVASYDYNISSSTACTGDVLATANVGNVLSKNSTGLSLTNGNTYNNCQRPIDNAGNVGSWAYSDGVTVDNTLPTASITTPTNSGAYNSLTTISGTASDTGSGVQDMTIWIRRLSDSYYWSGSAWQVAIAYLGATGTTSWSYNSSSVTWTSGVQYQVEGNAQDVAGNTQSPTSSNTFTFDNSAPTFGGVSTATATSDTTIDLTWTAATDDVSAGGNISYDICESTTAGSCVSSFTVNATVVGVTTTSRTALSGATRYYFVVRARDEATNTDTNTVEQSATTWGTTGLAQAVAGGEDHGCALMLDGTVRCWGSNSNGQVGDGTAGANRLTPVAVSTLTGAVAVAAGRYHSCAVLSDGTVKCWGINTQGQLGDGTVSQRNTPVAVSTLTNTVAIASGYLHMCALISDGSVNCWGANNNANLGDGTSVDRTTPVAVSSLTGIVGLGMGAYHSCALVSDGTVRCWGSNSSGEIGDGVTSGLRMTPVAVSTLSTAIALEGGYGHSCALINDGSVKCWGLNSLGQLGDGTGSNKTTPVAVSTLTGAVAIGGGEERACALLSDGTVRCWGRNVSGELGDGTTVNKNTPVAVSTLTNAVAMAAGTFFNCALRADGEVACWGKNQLGDLGDGTSVDRWTPVAVSFTAGTMGVRLPRLTYGTASGAPARPFREGLSTHLGNHTCSLISDGTVKCWGSNAFGQLGDGTTADKSTPVPVTSLSSVIGMTGGSSHTCSLLSDGTVKCWGRNNLGQLGDGTTANKTTPVSLSALSAAVAVAGGGDHTCALLSDGTVKCWGRNVYGQLGDGTTANKTTPVSVSALSAAVAVAGGGDHTCALASGGTVNCWGSNGSGQLGDGTGAGKTTPVAVSSLSSVVAVTGGFDHTCSLISDGTVKCWGYNGVGQVGDGTTADRWTPVPVTSLSSVIGMAGGYSHTCSLLPDGTVKCWGYNSTGQLGDGTTADRLTPVATSSLSGVLAVSGGEQHTCGLLSNGTVKCWGWNIVGQLGDGTTANKSTPVPVTNLP